MAHCNTGDPAPKPISFDSLVVDVNFHPSKNVIAAGDIDGDVTIHSYSTSEENHLLMTLTHHKKSCRAVRFLPSGTKLATVSKDKSLAVVDVDQGKLIQSVPKAHESALYCLLPANDNILVTGDDDGTVKVWDMRQQPRAVMDVKENEEFISDLLLDDKQRLLLTTSGDGTLTALDIRKHKMKMQSELMDAELLSIAPVKKSSKVVVGDGEGIVSIFNWGEWGNISDRFPGHPISIDCIVPISDDIIITGSMDGCIRAVHVLPNRILGVLGEHKNAPVENMSLSHCSSYVASCSHDQTVKFWNVNSVRDSKVDTRVKAKKEKKNMPLKPVLQKDDFFADLAEPVVEEESEMDEESDDSNDDEEDIQLDSDASDDVGKDSDDGDDDVGKDSDDGDDDVGKASGDDDDSDDVDKDSSGDDEVNGSDDDIDGAVSDSSEDKG